MYGFRLQRLQTLTPAEVEKIPEETKSLDLSQNYINSLDARLLVPFTQLTELYLVANNLTEIPDLSVLPNLSKLSLSSNKIVSTAGISSLFARVQDPSQSPLALLDLRSNKIESFEGFPDDTGLKWLSLSSNRLAELKLPRLPKLEFLGAYANQLKDVPFLVQTPALQKAFLGGPSYEISEEEILRETLRLIPGIQWFNGVFVSSSRRRGLLEAMKEEK